MSLDPDDFFAEIFAVHPALAALGQRDRHGYYGRREVGGQVVAIVSLTFGRARIVTVDPIGDCPMDGW